jgi:hypothetical protein
MCPLRQPGSRHFQIPTLGQHVSHLGQGNPVRIAYSPVWLDAVIRHQPKGPALTLSLSSAYKRGQWLEISAPFRRFLPHAEVSAAAHSLPVSWRLAWPFADSLGRPNPRTPALLLPQVSCPSGKSSGLHRTFHCRPLLDAGELLLLYFRPPMRHGLMSVVVLCSSATVVGASSPTKT